MRNKIYFLIMIIIVVISCSKEKKKEEGFLKTFDTREIQGLWRIVPSTQNETILFEPDSEAKLKTDSTEFKVYLMKDSSGMRILTNKEDENSIGYFLFSEKKDDIWMGIYRDELVRIERIREKKKSVLQ